MIAAVAEALGVLESSVDLSLEAPSEIGNRAGVWVIFSVISASGPTNRDAVHAKMYSAQFADELNAQIFLNNMLSVVGVSIVEVATPITSLITGIVLCYILILNEVASILFRVIFEHFSRNTAIFTFSKELRA